jgi:glutamate/tyrosine decarboxylase-like PLP-dependent enzyme
MLDSKSLSVLIAALEKLDAGFTHLPEFAARSSATAQLHEVLSKTAERLQDNFPYFHPLYAGQMLKPPHPVARLAYALAMYINPNNHALDGGRATSALEKDAVAEIAAMIGWKEFLGHLCSGGTMANLEALWVAGQLHRRKKILANEQAHYTHKRISGVLQLEFESIRCDDRGRMDLDALEHRLKENDVGAVVATLGTTATGSVDPLAEMLVLRERYGFRIHVDAAYGGYFALASNLSAPANESFSRIADADSVVIDPHKHGLQPYGCGCVIFRDPAVGKLYRHESPYTYFSSAELHLGEISLECSRPGAAAAALWATQKLLPLIAGGEFAKGLEAGREAALQLYARLKQDERFAPAFEPELDIVAFLPNENGKERASARSRAIFAAAAKRDLHLAVAELPLRFWRDTAFAGSSSTETVTCLRSVLMKPEHLEWIGLIWERLIEAHSGTVS